MIKVIAQLQDSNKSSTASSENESWGSELIQQFSNMGNELLAFIPKLLILRGPTKIGHDLRKQITYLRN